MQVKHHRLWRGESSAYPRWRFQRPIIRCRGDPRHELSGRTDFCHPRRPCRHFCCPRGSGMGRELRSLRRCRCGRIAPASVAFWNPTGGNGAPAASLVGMPALDLEPTIPEPSSLTLVLVGAVGWQLSRRGKLQPPVPGSVPGFRPRSCPSRAARRCFSLALGCGRLFAGGAAHRRGALGQAQANVVFLCGEPRFACLGHRSGEQRICVPDATSAPDGPVPGGLGNGSYSRAYGSPPSPGPTARPACGLQSN